MAQQVNVSYVDDLDGSEAQGTLSFGLDGRTYEIDLSRQNAARLRDIYARYVDAGRRVGGSGRAAKSARSAAAAADREHNQAIREWALGQGMKVSNHGRLPSEVVEAYNSKDVERAVVEAPVIEPEVEAPVKKPHRSRAKAKAESQQVVRQRPGSVSGGSYLHLMAADRRYPVISITQNQAWVSRQDEVVSGPADSDNFSVLSLMAQAPDAGGWTVTTSVAAAAVAIGLMNLLITTWATGRRERAKWARESLAEAFYAFVNESYLTADLARDHLDALWAGNDTEAIAATKRTLNDQHDVLRRSLTKIRLLARTKTTQQAQAVRQAHSNMRSELSPQMTMDRYQELLRATAKARQELIDDAKKAMLLPR